MLIHIWIFKRLKTLGWILLLLGIPLFFCVSGGAVEEEYRREEAVVQVERIDREWYVSVTPSLGYLGQGREVALLLTLTVSEGAVMEDIRVEKGAEGMNVGISTDRDGKTATILLDGIPSESQRILQVYTEGDLTVSEGYYGGAFLYCMGENGEIITHPLIFEDWDNSPSSEDLSSRLPEQESSPTETDHFNASDLLDKMSFIGCQETPLSGGMYSVRFIFEGNDEMYPVYCKRGKGSMTVETGKRAPASHIGNESSQSVWNMCTFKGLLENVKYEFEVQTGEGRIRVTYMNGEFLGFSGE